MTGDGTIPIGGEKKDRKPTRTKQTSFDQRIQTGDPDFYRKKRAELISKRDEYEIDKKGNITDRGVEKYARQMYRTNKPLTQAQLDKARQAAVGGAKITNEKGQVIGTTTGKYGGNLPRRRNKNAKTYEEIKKEIDSKEKKDKKPEAFIGDKPPEREQKPPEREQKPPDRERRKPPISFDIPGAEGPKDMKDVKLPRLGPVEKAKEFAKDNPALGYASYDLGKGIIGKLMKIKGAVPGVVGGTVGRRSARGGGGL